MKFFKKGGVGEPHTEARSPKEKHRNYTRNLLKNSLQNSHTRPNDGDIAL